MEEFRDLEAEIGAPSARQQIGKVIADFITAHNLPSEDSRPKASLLAQVQRTGEYLQPILDAMELEGSYKLSKPAYLRGDGSQASYAGSAWTCRMQQELLDEISQSLRDNGQFLRTNVSDEFKESWYLVPWEKRPFYHPEVLHNKVEGLHLKTVTEAIYEKPEQIFDTGFFSNTASELRAKLNSPQVILHRSGIKCDFVKIDNIASKLNTRTMEWALEHAPAKVKQRYLERGIRLIPADDIEHHSGPAWIWSFMEYRPARSKDGREYRTVHSHVMTTPIDHPVPFAGGKLYCKLLSPAKVLDWMFTDCLRSKPNLSQSQRSNQSQMLRFGSDGTLCQ